jgi:type II secretory pathway pseudopilin PulG
MLEKMKNKKVARRGSRGNQMAYTLAEVIVSVALVAILFVSLYGGMTSGFAVTQASRENLRATQIMLEYMEGIRLYNWDQLTSSNWIPSTFTNYYYPLAIAGESRGIPYYGTIAVTNANLNPASSYSTNMRSIVVTVNWTNANTPKTRTMTTYVARNGVQNYVFSSINN